MTREEILEFISNRGRDIAKQLDIALDKIKLCAKEGDKPAVEFWKKRSKECELLSKEYENLMKEISK